MKSYRVSFILSLVLICALESNAQKGELFYQLTKKACQAYPGDNPTFYISDFSRQYENPLATTALGKMILKNSFISSFRDYNYMAQDEILAQLLKSDHFKRALDECYGDKKLSKGFFVFFLNQLDLMGKTSSFSLDAASFMGGSFIFIKFSNFVGRRLAWIKGIFEWAGRTVTVTVGATMTLITGKAVYTMVRKYNESMNQDKKQNTEKSSLAFSYQEVARSSLQSIEEQISTLKHELKNKNSENDKAILLNLVRELEHLDYHMRRQMNELKK